MMASQSRLQKFVNFQQVVECLYSSQIRGFYSRQSKMID